MKPTTLFFPDQCVSSAVEAVLSSISQIGLTSCVSGSEVTHGVANSADIDSSNCNP